MYLVHLISFIFSTLFRFRYHHLFQCHFVNVELPACFTTNLSEDVSCRFKYINIYIVYTEWLLLICSIGTMHDVKQFFFFKYYTRLKTSDIIFKKILLLKKVTQSSVYKNSFEILLQNSKFYISFKFCTTIDISISIHCFHMRLASHAILRLHYFFFLFQQ